CSNQTIAIYSCEDGLERRPVDSWVCDYSTHRKHLREQRFSMGRAVRSPNTCLKTPQYFKEGRLKPFVANNVDIPFARARRLKPCPRTATAHSGEQSSAYVGVYRLCTKNSNSFGGTSNRKCF